MRKLAGAAVLGLVVNAAIAAGPVDWDRIKDRKDPLETPPLDPAVVERARQSRPVADEKAARDKLGFSFAAKYIATGEIAGKVLFEERFDDPALFAKRWKTEGSAKLLKDESGVGCIELTPTKPAWSSFRPSGRDVYVEVDEMHPIAILWDVRSPSLGTPPYIRVDFGDAEGRGSTLRGEYQLRSSIDPTQPTIFQRNMNFCSAQMPKGTHKLCIQFFHLPTPDDADASRITNVRIVDYAEAVERALARRAPVVAERGAAADDAVLAYVSDSLASTYPVMPDSADVPGRAGDTLRIRECAGERTRAEVILWSKADRRNVTVSFSDLRSDEGAIPASALSAKVVKAHYQAVGAPDGCLALADGQVLVPELLLNDDELVIPDHARQANYVKYSWGGKTWYVNINEVWTKGWADYVPPERMPITDAKTLHPFSLQGGLNKQIALRLSVPKGTAPGTYRGEVAFLSDGQSLVRVPLEVEVLPFALPERAETSYSKDCEYEMGLYLWGWVDKKDRISVSNMGRSREQILNEYRTLIDNGVTSPAFIYGERLVYNETEFRRHLDVLREAGFPTKGRWLHLGSGDLIGNDTNAVNLAARKAQMARAVATAREYGWEGVYFYGLDEARGERLLSQRPAWQACHEAGGRVMVSGYSRNFELMGDLQDLCVYADSASSAKPSDWHSLGHRIWKYNTPQAGPENPMLFRREYGLYIWSLGFDGANTYCNISGSRAWNDISGRLRFRLMGNKSVPYRTGGMYYPTTDGVIETLALTGLESAIKDVRYMTAFLQALRAHPNAAAKTWYAGINPMTEDPHAIRRQAIDWILRMTK